MFACHHCGVENKPLFICGDCGQGMYCGSACQQKDMTRHYAYICGKGTKREREEEDDPEFGNLPNELVLKVLDKMDPATARIFGDNLSSRMTSLYRLMDFPRRTWTINVNTIRQYSTFAPLIRNVLFSDFELFRAWPTVRSLRSIQIEAQLPDRIFYAFDWERYCPLLERLEANVVVTNAEFTLRHKNLQALLLGFVFQNNVELPPLDFSPLVNLRSLTLSQPYRDETIRNIVLTGYPPALEELSLGVDIRGNGGYAFMPTEEWTIQSIVPFPSTLKVLDWGDVTTPLPFEIPPGCHTVYIPLNQLALVPPTARNVWVWIGIPEEGGDALIMENMLPPNTENLFLIGAEGEYHTRVTSLPPYVRKLAYCGGTAVLHLLHDYIFHLDELDIEAFSEDDENCVTIVRIGNASFRTFQHLTHLVMTNVSSVAGFRMRSDDFFNELNPNMRELQLSALNFIPEGSIIQIRDLLQRLPQLEKLRLMDVTAWLDEPLVNDRKRFSLPSRLDAPKLVLLSIRGESIFNTYGVTHLPENLEYLMLESRAGLVQFQSRGTECNYPEHLKYVSLLNINQFPWPEERPPALIEFNDNRSTVEWVTEEQSEIVPFPEH